MAEGGGGPNLHSLGLLDSKTSTSGGDGMANEKEIFEAPLDALKKIPGTIAKLADGIPLIGPLLSKLIPASGVGEVSIFANVSKTESWVDKPMNQAKGPQGGSLYNAIAAPLLKNSKITDHTGGTGGGGGGGGDGGGGGGGGGAGFESYAASSGMGEMFIAAGGGNRFEYGDVSPRDLGTFSPPATGGGMGSRGADTGMDV